jgi:hypothetical protein
LALSIINQSDLIILTPRRESAFVGLVAGFRSGA